MVISKETYNKWVNDPSVLKAEDLNDIKSILEMYPYCSTTHMLYSKALSNCNSILFNNQLKITATHCGDRSRLFDLISKKYSSENKVKVVAKQKKEIQKSALTVKEQLKIGEAIEFKETEMHTFDEWLKLSTSKKIKQPTKKLDKQLQLIEQFIEQNPKIEAKKESFYSASAQAKNSVRENTSFITETLAKVYLEQEQYEKAKKAYLELSLKYPQKSSLFASQIELINKLIKNK
ncbi:MAG: hypothetical protein ACON4Y_03255 [Flavobacteriales bacterium]